LTFPEHPHLAISSICSFAAERKSLSEGGDPYSVQTEFPWRHILLSPAVWPAPVFLSDIVDINLFILLIPDRNTVPALGQFF
jgi:hypothetical protein